MQNQILITLDSCRWDTFQTANLPFLKRFPYRRCWTNGTYTLPAHQSFFIGKLPHDFSGDDDFDTCAISGRPGRVRLPQWRLADGTSQKRGRFILRGQNIIEGFSRIGFETIGTGAMRWFDPTSPATFSLLQGFQHYQYFRTTKGDGRDLQRQIAWILDTLSRINTKPFFLFLNVGETHHPYSAAGHSFRGEWGNRKACAKAQRASLEWVDGMLSELFENIANCHAVICGDHGDCWGEDGLWGHGFYHPQLMEVPMVIVHKQLNVS